MSLFKMFDIMRLNQYFETEIILNDGDLDDDDLAEWRESVESVTNLKLEDFDAVDDYINYLGYILDDEEYKLKNKYAPSPKLQTTLKAYYYFYFEAYIKGFKNDDDLVEYNELLFNLLSGADAKNYEPYDSVSAIRNRFDEIIEREIYSSLKETKLDFLDKTKIIICFLEYYEGEDAVRYGDELLREIKPDGIYNEFFKCETLGDLLEDFAEWYNSFLACDEDGEWVEGDEDASRFVECINYGRS